MASTEQDLRHHDPAPGSTIPQKRGLDSATSRPKPKVTRACDICKAKKSKCSGEQPCESCSRRGIHCQYEAVYSRGKAPTPRRMEIPAPAAPSVVPPIPRRDLRASTALRSSDVETVQDPPSRGSPGLEVGGQYSDPTSGLSFLHRAWRRISNKESSQAIDGQLGSMEDNQLITCAGDKPIQEIGRLQLPPIHRCRELLTLYFDVCIVTYRLLHKPTVESWLLALLKNCQLQRPLFFGPGRAKAAAVLSVLAVASFHEEKAHGNGDFSPYNEGLAASLSDELFSEASSLSAGETGVPRLESAQSRLIQVLYLLMSCRFNQAWYLFGHTLQIISALGLHRRDDRKRRSASHKRDYIEEQCRKRTFWVAYTLDKYLGVIFGRPRHYHDDDIDQDFPDSVNDEDMTNSGPQVNETDDCHTDSLVFHAKLAQIAERISREVYSIKPVPDHTRLASAHRLGAELRQWKASLPPFLGAINPSSLIPSFRRQATALRLSYYHAVMLAHRPFLLKNTTRNNDEMRSLAKDGLTECISAARSVLENVDRMAREGRLFHAFWWTHYVCFCALVIVYVWAIQESNNSNSLDERRIILDQAERCLQHLEQATASNSPSRRYSIILQELRAEAKRKTARSIQEQTQTIPIQDVTTIGGNRVEVNQNVVSDTVMPVTAATLQIWPSLFGSPVDTSTPGLQDFLDDWQTTDWLQLDSSAFGPFPEFENASLDFMDDVS